MLLEVKVKPGAGKDKILSFREPHCLEIALSAKAERNEANNSLCNFLAKLLGIDRKKIKILKGKSSPKKILALEGVSEEELRRLLEK